ncbi:hypothetical protein [Acaryochloris sp. IP29b_bin.148]|uniref:hypothetical protein n=1 Tax=Acaryochloris sp. IP29b_bin.148 TaxID=2969218 RepID=UPI00262A4102|nr:hypothetical protein [Acaryochloris sp. IP29b_bin.148]
MTNLFPSNLKRLSRELFRQILPASGLTIATSLMLGMPVWAEGSKQIGLNQDLYEYDTRVPIGTDTGLTEIDRPLYLDNIQVGEVINIALCGRSNSDDVKVELYRHSNPVLGQYEDAPASNAGTLVRTFTRTSSNIDCNDPLDAPLTPTNTPNLFRHLVTGAGTYEIRLFNDSTSNGTFNRYDITVTPDLLSNPDPTEKQGRLWTYTWGFNTGSFNNATDADYYTVVPGLSTGFYVWKLDLTNFSGFVYEILANDIGLNSPNALGRNVSGVSAPFANNRITPRFKIYTSYPAANYPQSVGSPNVSNFRFVDANGNSIPLAPGQTGFFKFTSDTDGTYAITIDVSDPNGGAPDGQFGAGDVLLAGRTTANTEITVPWNGQDNTGQQVPDGTYNARMQARVGEYHFVAGDAEYSGTSPPSGGTKGLTIFGASSNTSTTSTQVYWDDITALPGLGGTSSLPNGVPSTDLTGHLWSFSLGNKTYIDTYVYGTFSQTSTPLTIGTISDPNILLVKRITRVNGQTSNGSTNLDVYIDDPNYDYDDNTLADPAPDPPDTENWPTNDPNNPLDTSPSSFLRGQINGGETKPGDEVEYTIYFLSTGDAEAVDVKICDRIPEFQSFVTNAFNADPPGENGGVGASRGILLQYEGEIRSYTNDLDGDIAEFYPPNTTLPPDAASVCGDSNANPTGTVVVNLGNVPAATSPGQPSNSYGFLRFRAKVE